MNRREFVVAGLALAFAPEALGRGLGGTPVALVTADLEAAVVAIDLSTGKVLRRIPTAPGPRSIQTVGATAVVAHTAHGAVTLIDAARLRVRTVLHDFEQPRYTAAAGDGRSAFVTDSGSWSVVVVDVIRGKVVRRLAVGGPARHVSIEGSRLWTALGTKAARLAVVDVSEPVRPRLLGAVKAPFLAHDVGFASAGGRLWVTSGNRHELALFDPRTARAVTRYAADAPPQHVTFSGRLAFVTSGDDGTLRTHDAATGRLLRMTRVPVGSYNVQEGWSGRAILTPSLARGTLCVADRRGRVVRRLDVARSSHDACFVVSA
jgi:DNA-binding beta-propeller fold protein YncE